MKDIIALIVFYLIWNSPVHEAHPTMVPVLFTLYLVIMAIELYLSINKKK